jgi:hypothetical protein
MIYKTLIYLATILFTVAIYLMEAKNIPCVSEGTQCNYSAPCCHPLICYEETQCINATNIKT